MPDEDQLPGGSTPTPETQIQTDSPGLEAPLQEQSSSNLEEGAEGAEPQGTGDAQVPLNTVGAALEEFNRNREERRTGFPAPPSPNQPKPRDYSGLEGDEINWFKHMGGKTFDELKPRYLQWKTELPKAQARIKELEAQVATAGQTSVFEQEGAYQLTPEYQQHTAELNNIDGEIQHWRKQLMAIRKNEEWIPLVRGPNGQIMQGAPQPASPEGEDVVSDAIMRGYSIRNGIAEKINSLQSNFQNQHKGFITRMGEIEKQIFAGADQKALESAMQTKLPMFPQHLQNNPIVRSLAKALAVIDGMAILLQRQKATVTTNQVKARTTANAGPRAGDLQPGATPGQSVGSAMEEFRKAKALGIA